MLKKLLLPLCMLLAIVATGRAQVTSEPSPLKEDSQNVVIFFHADQGNKALAGLGSDAQIYAHTGVITTQSTDGADWKHAPNWGDNAAKYKLEYVSTNLWKLNIGNLREYYGITNPDEVITKLAFVFRTADNSKQGKAEGNKDIFLDVQTSKLLLDLTSTLGGTVVTPGKEKVTFTLTANQPADLTLSLAGTTLKTGSNVTSITADYTFATNGSYTVVGTATAAGQSATVEETFVFPKASEQADYPGGVPQMGAVRNADGSVTFCLGAPQKTGVIIVGSWDNYEVLPERSMKYQDYQGYRYFWTTVSGLEAGKQYIYYYLIDGSLKVGDPYAKLVLDPYNDKYIAADVYPELPEYPWDKVRNVPLAVYQSDINDYDWQVKDFKGVDPANLMIYELLFRDFTGTEGQAKGNGTVRLAMEKIPYLKSLGINAVELLPINEFNGNISWGYNPNFYFAPDKAYGTPDDYKEFIDLCHQEGIAVILDMVFNQTEWLHPWYQMYPVGSNPFYNASAPHAYSVLNDWNQGNEMLQRHFEDCLRYWVEEYHVDGYRFDLVKGLGLNSSYADNGDSATNAYNKSRVEEMRRLQVALQQVKADAYFINENLAGQQEENEMAAFGQLNWANYNYAGQKFACGQQGGSSLSGMYAPYGDRTLGSTVSYLESHDEQRLAYAQNVNGVQGVAGVMNASMHRLGSAACQMILAPGAHMIWQFSEFGNFDSTKDASGGNNTDPKTVRWNLLKVPARKGLFDEYAALNHIRLNYPELFSNSAKVEQMYFGGNDWSNGRILRLKAGDKELYAAINPEVSGAAKAITVNFAQADNSKYRILAQSYNSNASFDATKNTITVEPNCFVVVGLADMTSVDDLEFTNALDDEDAPLYDLSGRRVENPLPGIYIRAGKKIIIR